MVRFVVQFSSKLERDDFLLQHNFYFFLFFSFFILHIALFFFAFQLFSNRTSLLFCSARNRNITNIIDDELNLKLETYQSIWIIFCERNDNRRYSFTLMNCSIKSRHFSLDKWEKKNSMRKLKFDFNILKVYCSENCFIAAKKIDSLVNGHEKEWVIRRPCEQRKKKSMGLVGTWTIYVA